MTDYYVDSQSGSDAASGGIADPWLTLAHANSQLASSDTLVVRYAGGAPYAHAASVMWDCGADITGADSAGVRWDLGAGSVIRDERPLLTWGATDGLVIDWGAAIAVRGLELQGGGPGVGLDGIQEFAGTADITLQGIEAHNWTVCAALYDCTVLESMFRDCNIGLGVVAGATADVASSIFARCDYHTGTLDAHAVRLDAGASVALENCTVYRCGDATAGVTYGIVNTLTGATFSNVLVVDSYSRWGLPGGTATASNSYTSDGATYHVIANFNPSASGTDTELDPGFYSASAGLYYISDAALLTGGAAASAALLYDGTPMPLAPPVGALSAIPALSVVVRGTHDLVVYGLLPDVLVDVTSWALSGGESHLLPLVAVVSRLSATELAISTDRPMQYGVSYTLTAADGRAVAFVGQRVDVPGQPAKPEDAILVDYLAPFVNRDGTGGGFLSDEGGDYVLRGGLDALLGVLWHRVLTRVGELYYAPQAGIDLRHKGLVPPNLAREQRRLQQALELVPYVNSVQVTLTAEDHALIVTVRVDSDLGAQTQTRSIGS